MSTIVAFSLPHLSLLFSLTDCSMYLKDDNVYEGVEGLYLELDRTSQDPAVRLISDRQRAIIYIHDVDDGM